AVVLGWRLAKAWQDSRQAEALQQVRGGGPGAGRAWSGQGPRRNGATGIHGGSTAQRPGPRPVTARPAAGPEGTRVMAGGRTGRTTAAMPAAAQASLEADYPAADQPMITV